jgi:UTP--glucose-1-phosphate uridylyltransferase
MPNRVRKAVFPVAGLGTRLLPATKSIPKEMITIVDRPLIQYAVDEAREAGIEQLIFVTGRGKAALDDYFDIGFELETTMRERGKSLDALEPSRSGFGEVVSVRQQQPLGLGHAVWCARHIVGDEPFAVLLPDELMAGRPNCLAQMVEAYERVGGNIVAALEVPDSETHKYGVIDPGATEGRLTEIRGLIEKPAPGTAPSNLMLPGRYILQPEVMRALDAQEKGAGGEIQLTDAIARLIGREPVHAFRFEGERYDCGSAAGFVIANIAMALDRSDVGPAVDQFISSLRG